jgi:L-lactate dehydrogenase (cytochrome)
MRDEIETTMRMVGITSLEQAHPGLLNTLDIDGLVSSTMGDSDASLWKVKARL